jgi:hypothetical protein
MVSVGLYSSLQEPAAKVDPHSEPYTQETNTRQPKATHGIQKSNRTPKKNSEKQSKRQPGTECLEQQSPLVAHSAQHVTILLRSSHQIRHNLAHRTVGDVFVRAVASGPQREGDMVTHAQQLPKGHSTSCEPKEKRGKHGVGKPHEVHTKQPSLSGSTPRLAISSIAS